ncbi:MAG: protein kinase, partial [Planctomycetes bacterium]|nr:protein kinase [Planctomycetota bacterium]
THAKLLPPRRVAELMEQVCHAVQYAHDRAVIHRDLKPANIMLENDKIPRLADFGLAKNMHEDDGLTMTGQVMGTPSYMAPEQATGKLDEISNRTDVYSLGATLYALLAGKPPFSGGTMLETIRQVVRTEAESLTHVSRSVPRDLQTICEKCLAKSPSDRYASAADLADDLRRYLDGFPISARPLAPWARSLRWCQRNPIEATLLAITATALIAGTIVSVRFGLEAKRQAAVARASLAEARENAQKLRQSIEESIVFASEDVLAQEPGMQAARAVLLKTAQRYYAELVTQTTRDAASQSALAEAQFKLAKVQMALGQDVEAGEALSKSLDIQKKLADQQPRDAVTLTALAKSHNQLATLAQKKWQGLTQLRDMGKLAGNQATKADRQLDDWQQHSTEVVRLRKLVVELEPEDLESRRLLASAMMNEGNAIGIRGYARNDLTEQDRARQKILEAQKVRLAVLQEFPEEVLMRRDLARGYFNLANIELQAADQDLDDQSYSNRLQLSADDLTQAIDAYERLPSRERVLDTQLELARCYRLRADAYFRLLGEKGMDKVVSDYRHAEKLLKALTDRNPNVYRYRVVLAETQYNFCGFWFLNTQNDQAAEQLAKSRSTLLQALRVDPQNANAADQLVLFSQNIVDHLIEKKEFDLAGQLLRDAIQELLALQQDSEEYSGLQPSIETLESLARKVQSLRIEAKTLEDVTGAVLRQYVC